MNLKFLNALVAKMADEGDRQRLRSDLGLFAYQVSFKLVHNYERYRMTKIIDKYI